MLPHTANVLFGWGPNGMDDEPPEVVSDAGHSQYFLNGPATSEHDGQASPDFMPPDDEPPSL